MANKASKRVCRKRISTEVKRYGWNSDIEEVLGYDIHLITFFNLSCFKENEAKLHQYYIYGSNDGPISKKLLFEVLCFIDVVIVGFAIELFWIDMLLFITTIWCWVFWIYGPISWSLIEKSVILFMVFIKRLESMIRICYICLFEALVAISITLILYVNNINIRSW